MPNASLRAHITADDVSADCYAAESITPETNHERVLFRKLVHRYTDELETVRKPCANSRVRPLDVMEIFCGPQSQLTHQCKQLGFQAERFGYQQGNLQTETGRCDLFHQLVTRFINWLPVSQSMCGPVQRVDLGVDFPL